MTDKSKNVLIINDMPGYSKVAMAAAVFSVLALRGDIAADNVMLIVTAVISFYFGTQHEKKV